jgi:hypothetical protein
MHLLRRVGAKGLLIEAHMQLAELQIARGDLTAARRTANRALADARRFGDSRMEARGARVVGLVLAGAGSAAAADARLSESAALARRIGAGYDEAHALLALGRLRVVSGTPARARTPLRRAAMIFERMGVGPELAEARRLLETVDAPPGGRTLHGSRERASGPTRKGRPASRSVR